MTSSFDSTSIASSLDPHPCGPGKVYRPSTGKCVKVRSHSGSHAALNHALSRTHRRHSRRHSRRHHRSPTTTDLLAGMRTTELQDIVDGSVSSRYTPSLTTSDLQAASTLSSMKRSRRRSRSPRRSRRSSTTSMMMRQPSSMAMSL